MVDALFAAFVALQVAYLFGSLDTPAAAGLTYADCARRGCRAARGRARCRRRRDPDARDRRRSRGFIAAALALLGLTGITLVSSFLRLRLYQDAYGWTELRFWVVLSIGWLAVALLAVGVLVVLGRSGRLVHVLGALGVAGMLVANVVGPQASSRREPGARDNPSLGWRAAAGLTTYLTLGDDAVPAMWPPCPSWPSRPAEGVHLEAAASWPFRASPLAGFRPARSPAALRG
jgi:hypothetical protein